MIDIAIIVGSTRPGRRAVPIANWIHGIASKRSDARFQLVDLMDFDLPLLDEPAPALLGKYTQLHTRNWAAKIAFFDGFIFIAPEYNHGISASLKNAIDFLYKEWNDKAAGFVGYGGGEGARVVEQLRLVMAEMQVATVRAQVGLSLFTDFENFHTFRPAPHREAAATPMLDQLIAWSRALRAVRLKQKDSVAA
jgi:NAD(P)H-dependent FMN reductase